MESLNVLNNPQIDRSETDKVAGLVDYLSELANLRTKSIRDVKDYKKVLWVSDIPRERGCFTRAWGRDEEHEPDEWIEVQSRREPELPDVPDQCKEWVNTSLLQNKNDLPKLLPEITRQIRNPDWAEESDQPETIKNTERLENHPEVRRVWDRYFEDKWRPWMEEHDTWGKVNKVYSALFAIHQEQVRLGEQYELVLGLGLLTWQTPAGQRVCRHLVVADAILEFEAGLGKFTVRSHTEGAKLRLELDMLDIEEQPVDADAEEKAKTSLGEAEDDPWEKGRVEDSLKVLVHSISAEGDYHDSLKANNVRASTKPVVKYAPALILRKRSAKSLTETLKRIKERIEDDEDIPGEFAALVGMCPEHEREPSDEPEEANAVFDGEVFFPKPSNEDQRRIVDKIRAENGVLVQGPPGTGKSHTIANLICHLLATGQRTLITAKTPRALRVLKDLVPVELHPLCINLLGSGLEEYRSLESSVDGILRKSEEWNESSAKDECTKLEKHLQKLRKKKAEVNRRLCDIRESETHTQSVAEGSYQGTAARIAEAVNKDQADYEWFMDKVPLDETCPISANHLQSVLEALRQFTPEKRRETSLARPQLPTERFPDLVREEEEALKEEQKWAHGADERLADLLAGKNPPVIEAIRSAFSTFQSKHRRIAAKPHSWMNDALRDVLGDNSGPWRGLLRVTDDVIASVEDIVSTADETWTQIKFKSPDSNTNIRSLHKGSLKLKEHLKNGGKLGWWGFRPKPVKEHLYVIMAVKLGGRRCSTVEHFTNLADALHVRIECEKAWNFWKEKSEKVKGPYTLQLDTLRSLKDALEDALALGGLIDKCREAISHCPGINEPVWADESCIDGVVSSCHLELARYKKRLAVEEIQNVEDPISRVVAKGSAHPVANDLLSAIRSRDVNKFSHCVNTFQDLEKQSQNLQKLDEDLSKLRSLLPEFTDSLEKTYNESCWEERIQGIGGTWRWAQARYWIEDYIRQEDVPALVKREKRIEDEINSTIAELASLRAWSFCLSRLEEKHRRHMESWRQSMKRLGRGTGKHAPRHRRDAQEHLNKCLEAVPAWVMPLHRIWDTVDPAAGMFDVIIVDEASQCGFEALPLFYLGKKILIVGDDKQISPDAVGLSRDSVRRLMEKYLHDFDFKSLFDIESSLFDHGKLLYGKHRITLREHFRCMPEIIRFSDKLCYSGTPLIPLRQYGPERLPPLEHVFVREGYREGTNNRVINRPEAKAIVDRISEMCDDRQYDDKTMGVVVLQGEAQAELIQEQLLERLGAEEIKRRRLLCGNPYSFQGDERDIVFLSLVAATNERIGPLTNSADERRFNVAASRACDMMILFHSVTGNDLNDRCLRKRLLEFFENKRPRQIDGIDQEELERRAVQDNRSVVKQPKPFDSWFEVDVALELLRKSFKVSPQWKVAGKRIDLVVEGGQARLAVECDGDHWHGADHYEDDMQRQRQLERCGWEFFRVRESAFYSNKENALAGLWQVLEDRGISPV